MKVACLILVSLGLLLGVTSADHSKQQTKSEEYAHDVEYGPQIFYGIYNIKQLQSMSYLSFGYNNVEVTPDTELCLDIYALENIKILAYGGYNIRECIHFPVNELVDYFNNNDDNQLFLNFTLMFAGCSKKGPSSEQIINCYADSISTTFTAINATLTPNFMHNRDCFRRNLAQVFHKLDRNSADLQDCVKNFKSLPVFNSFTNFSMITNMLKANPKPTNPIPVIPVPVLPPQPVQPAQPVKPVQPAKPIPVVPAQPVKPVQPAQPVKPAQPLKPVPAPLPSPVHITSAF